jgi:hypothetical protein
LPPDDVIAFNLHVASIFLSEQKPDAMIVVDLDRLKGETAGSKAAKPAGLQDTVTPIVDGSIALKNLMLSVQQADDFRFAA